MVELRYIRPVSAADVESAGHILTCSSMVAGATLPDTLFPYHFPPPSKVPAASASSAWDPSSSSGVSDPESGGRALMTVGPTDGEPGTLELAPEY